MRITSVIETYTEGADMKSDREEKEPIVESNADELKEYKSDSSDERSHYHRSEANSDRNGFFHRVKHEHKGIKQVTNVNINIQPEQDCMTGCFKAIFKGFNSAK